MAISHVSLYGILIDAGTAECASDYGFTTCLSDWFLPHDLQRLDKVLSEPQRPLFIARLYICSLLQNLQRPTKVLFEPQRSLTSS